MAIVVYWGTSTMRHRSQIVITWQDFPHVLGSEIYLESTLKSLIRIRQKLELLEDNEDIQRLPVVWYEYIVGLLHLYEKQRQME